MAGETFVSVEQLQWLDQNARDCLADPATEKKRKLTAAQRGWIEGQRFLRSRAAPRFPDAERWLWTDRSLSQASDWMSASFKASLLAPQDAVVDACSGAGVDAVAFALRGCSVTAIDADPAMSRLTEINAASHGVNVRAIQGCLNQELMQSLASEHAAIHVDPDRRPSNRRTSVAEDFSPPLDRVLDYASLFPRALIKLAPSTAMDEQLEQTIDQHYLRVWVGNRGECRQQVLVKGIEEGATREGMVGGEIAEEQTHLGRRAVLLSMNNALDLSVDSFTAARIEPTYDGEWGIETVGKFVFDLHPVLHASSLQVAWGREHGMQPLSDSTGYFTADQLPYPADSVVATQHDQRWCQAFEVREVLPWDDRQVRKWLRSVGAGAVEVKCRLAKIDANAFQRRYQSEHGVPVTLLVTKLDGRVRTLAAVRVH